MVNIIHQIDSTFTLANAVRFFHSQYVYGSADINLLRMGSGYGVVLGLERSSFPVFDLGGVVAQLYIREFLFREPLPISKDDTNGFRKKLAEYLQRNKIGCHVENIGTFLPHASEILHEIGYNQIDFRVPNTHFYVAIRPNEFTPYFIVRAVPEQGYLVDGKAMQDLLEMMDVHPTKESFVNYNISPLAPLRLAVRLPHAVRMTGIEILEGLRNNGAG